MKKSWTVSLVISVTIVLVSAIFAHGCGSGNGGSSGSTVTFYGAGS